MLLLKNVDLSYANLSSTLFIDTDLTNANLSYANLRNTVANCTLITCPTCGFDKNPKNSEFCEACGSELNFSGIASSMNISNANLSYADIHGASFRHVNFYGTNFNNAHLIAVDFGNANLRNSDLSEADINATNFTGADLENINLTNVKNLDRAFGLTKVIESPPKPVIVSSNGMITCPVCGYDKNPGNSEFCDACGAELPLLASSTSSPSIYPSEQPEILSDSFPAPATTFNVDFITCTVCGYDRNPGNSEFCDACGAELD